MATAAPPPADGQLAIRPSSPSIPITRPVMLLDEQIPQMDTDDMGMVGGELGGVGRAADLGSDGGEKGVGRAADLGSDGGEKGAEGVRMVGGQGYIDGGDLQMGKDGGDPQMGRDGGGERQQCKKVAEQNRSKKLKASSLAPNITKVSQVQVGEGKHHTENELPKPTSKKSRNSKVPLRVSSPIQVASSPGVNMLARAASSKRASLMVRPASVKKAKMARSPETSHQSPSSTMASPVQDLPHISPSLEDLSPGTRTTNSQGSKRKRRKLISLIWEEAVPIYLDGKLVEGRCIHCRQVFPAARDTGTSNLKRHLKVCEAKKAMNKMVEKLGHPGGIDPN